MKDPRPIGPAGHLRPREECFRLPASLSTRLCRGVAMRDARSIAVLLCLGLGSAACQPGAVHVPQPQQPTLQAVRLVGNRVCGSITDSAGTQFSFTCPPLPTVENSGWELTPIWAPSLSAPGKQHPNRNAVITVSAPTLTDIDVELARQGGAPNILMTQYDSSVPSNPGLPEEIAESHKVGVSATDDGTKKTWQVTVTISTCADYRNIQIFNKSSASPGRSNPLSVFLIRDPDPAQQACIGAPGTGLAKSGPGDPTSTPQTGACTGGGSRTLFQMCENCAATHPAAQNVYTEGLYCSWQEVLQTYGYNDPAGKSQVCTLNQVASRDACEGPP